MRKPRQLLDDNLVWTVVQELHQRTRSWSHLARDLQLTRHQVVHIVDRVTALGGWTCPLSHAPCRICGQPVISRGMGRPSTLHRWCAPPRRTHRRRNAHSDAGPLPALDQDLAKRLAAYADRPRLPRSQAWSLEQLMVLADTTKSLSEVARELGLTFVQVTTELKRLRSHGIEIQRRMGPRLGKPSNHLGHRNARTRAILADIEAGKLSHREIAVKHGASQSWVYEVANRDLERT